MAPLICLKTLAYMLVSAFFILRYVLPFNTLERWSLTHTNGVRHKVHSRELDLNRLWKWDAYQSTGQGNGQRGMSHLWNPAKTWLIGGGPGISGLSKET